MCNLQWCCSCFLRPVSKPSNEIAFCGSVSSDAQQQPYLEEEESRSLLDTVDNQLHRRRKGAAVRMEIEVGANREIVDRLQANFRLDPWQMFHVNGPPNLSRLFH